MSLTYQLTYIITIFLNAAVAVSIFAIGAPASAQGDDMGSAKEAFSRGQTAFDAGRYEEALAAFEESLAAFPHYRTLFNIALCQEKLGDVRGAIAMYQRYVEWPSEVPNREEVAVKLAQLQATLPPEPEQPQPPEEEQDEPEPCCECGHSLGQHTKGPVKADYCRHCPCEKFKAADLSHL